MTAPWHPSSLDLVTQQVVEHIWKVEFPTLDPSRSTVAAWDIQVTLDGGRSPYGTATFKAPASYMAEVPDGAGTVFTKLVPYSLPPVRIWAGWRHVIDGVLVDDLQILFSGFVTARRFVVEEGRGYVTFEAQTAEAVYAMPNSRMASTSIGNTWTSLKTACDAIEGFAGKWYRYVDIIEESGYMNTPTSGQLSSWRAGSFEPDDDVLDTLRAWAGELGQWVRGNVRSSLTTPALLVSADPYPFRTSYTLPSSVFTKIERTDDLDNWANILRLTCTWNSASGDPTTKKKQYLGPGAAAGNTGAVRSRDVTVQLKPPGGTLSTTYPLALAWLRRIQDMSEVFYTATGRAIWWLQPRIHGLQVSGLGLADVAGPISIVNFQVDQGSMTVAWNTNNTRT